MEKISRIIPGSPRTTSVDMKKERPVRASAANFGQPVSQSVNRGPKKHAVDEATRTFHETYGPNAKMAREADLVKKLNEEFFSNQGQYAPETNEIKVTETVVEPEVTATVPTEQIDNQNKSEGYSVRI